MNFVGDWNSFKGKMLSPGARIGHWKWGGTPRGLKRTLDPRGTVRAPGKQTGMGDYNVSMPTVAFIIYIRILLLADEWISCSVYNGIEERLELHSLYSPR